jgi:hypothetical protein
MNRGGTSNGGRDVYSFRGREGAAGGVPGGDEAYDDEEEEEEEE